MWWCIPPAWLLCPILRLRRCVPALATAGLAGSVDPVVIGVAIVMTAAIVLVVIVVVIAAIAATAVVVIELVAAVLLADAVKPI